MIYISYYHHKKEYLLMDFSTLKSTIQTEIKTGDLSLQVIFNRHISVIEKFKNEGYTYSVIFKKIDSGLHDEHLRTLIRNAKKKLTKTQETLIVTPKKTIPISNVTIEQTTTKVLNKAPTLDTNYYTLDNWNAALHYSINERILKRLERLNVKIEFIVSKNIPNSKRLSDFLIETECQSKYKYKE